MSPIARMPCDGPWIICKMDLFPLNRVRLVDFNFQKLWQYSINSDGKSVIKQQGQRRKPVIVHGNQRRKRILANLSHPLTGSRCNHMPGGFTLISAQSKMRSINVACMQSVAHLFRFIKVLMMCSVLRQPISSLMCFTESVIPGAECTISRPTYLDGQPRSTLMVKFSSC